MRDRVVTTAVLALVLVVLVGIVKPRPDDARQATRITESCFYVKKTFADDRADLLVLGDSRALRGLAPEELSSELSGLRVLNLAYNAGGLNDEIYDFAERRLDPDSTRPAVVLALTPLTLLDWKSANGQFRATRGTAYDQRVLQQHAPWLAEFFAPLRPSDLVRKIWRYPTPRTWELDYRDDGWLASRRSPADTTEALGVYEEQLADSRISPDLLDEFERRVQAWTARGIRVFALRMPSQVSMDALEDSMLAYDGPDLVRRLEGAGGTWIDVPRGGWRTYDGSHLDVDDARRLSRLVGRSIRETWPQAPLAAVGGDVENR